MGSGKISTSEPSLSMGSNTAPVPLALFFENRRRLVEKLRGIKNKSAVLLQGGSEMSFYDTDTTYNVFRQESYFMWCFGVTEADCYGVIDVATGESHLFFPRYPSEYAVWMGPTMSLEDYKTKYGVSHTYYNDEIPSVLSKLNCTILTLKGRNSDSGLLSTEADFDGIDKFEVDNKILFPVIADLRVIKTSYEIEVIKYVVEISSAAHRHVMRFAKSDKYEFQCESEFMNYCYKNGGCRHVSYTCICASGTNSAILHYGHAGCPNKHPLPAGKLCLFDMGANYFGYAADITVTFPIDGKFTPDQKMIYEAVLTANLAVFKAAKPGVTWTCLHLTANEVLLTKLKDGGILTGSVSDMMEADLAAIFQPHGLGHFLGLDVHDVGGYLPGYPERSTRPGLKSLRTARVLEEHMVLTIEPGCYFIDPLLNQALNDPKLSKFLVPDVLKRFRGFGGVRIEDDVLITKDGIINLTKVPRTVQEIEDWIAGHDSGKYA